VGIKLATKRKEPAEHCAAADYSSHGGPAPIASILDESASMATVAALLNKSISIDIAIVEI
jgi:hypothetical protein